MINIHMFSSATKVAGQGVGSVYTELMALLRSYFPDDFDIRVNDYSRSDISHYHTIDPQFYASTWSKRRGRKIGYVHFLPDTLESSLTLPRVAQSVLNKYVISFYKRMDEIVVVNPNFISRLGAYGIGPEHVTYIPNFVSQQTFHEDSVDQKHALRAQLGIPDDQFVVFGAGQVQERKGVDDFLELARRNPDKTFIWAGGFSFGKITNGYSHLKDAVANPPANVTFTGIIPRPTMVDYYNVADLFLLPSFEELFPMAVLEAFGTGTPVMVRDLELYDEIIRPYTMLAADVEGMNHQLDVVSQNADVLHHYQALSHEAANVYSEKRLAGIWHDFYTAQAQLPPRRGFGKHRAAQR